MNARDRIEQEINRQMGGALRRARLLKEQTLSQAAVEVGLSEFQFAAIEMRPARIPAKLLFDIVCRLGPLAYRLASEAWADLQLDKYRRHYVELDQHRGSLDQEADSI